MLQEAGHIKNKAVLILRHIQCLHMMNSEVAWVLVNNSLVKEQNDQQQTYPYNLVMLFWHISRPWYVLRIA